MASDAKFPRATWNLDNGQRISLITPAELATLAVGTQLCIIDGTTAIVGTDTIDGDTRGGYLAYGFAEPAPPRSPSPGSPTPSTLAEEFGGLIGWLGSGCNALGRFPKNLTELETALREYAALAAPPCANCEAELLAQAFHDAYERLAPSFGYETRRESAKPWDDVPEQNRRLMIAVCEELLPRLRAPLRSGGDE